MNRESRKEFEISMRYSSLRNENEGYSRKSKEIRELFSFLASLPDLVNFLAAFFFHLLK